MPRIRVHERALAHLSRGLYRSPASALRELVSNAWDANATRVSIDTNYPEFFQLSVEDNGDGFSSDDFHRLMSGGIGNSMKRTEAPEIRFGRPVIGRLGIGMLGIAQICGSFVVSSRPKSGKPFRAKVRLFDIAKEKMDQRDSDLVHEATTSIQGEQVSGKIVDVGQYEFMDYEKDDLPSGTRIVAGDVTPTFTQAFEQSLKLEGYVQVPLDWRHAVTDVLNDAASLQLLGDYWRLLWELAAASPVPYIADNALPRGVIRELNRKLNSYKFELVVDGRKLFKPVFLKGNEGGYTTKVIQQQTHKVYGRGVTFSGYIVVQEGRQLKPDELRGILVRIKNVAIGYYDPSMLDYRFNEGPRSRWVTGEIFVEQGLEDALNIDRDSFNRFHPEFRTLQATIHNVLRKEIFPEVYKNIDVRSDARRRKVARQREKALTQVVHSHTEGSVEIAKAKTDGGAESGFSSAQRTRSGIRVSVQPFENLPTSKPSRHLAQAILAVFEIALMEKDKVSQRKKFSALLLDLLRHW